jgi:hypothetical protein
MAGHLTLAQDKKITAEEIATAIRDLANVQPRSRELMAAMDRLAALVKLE